MAFPLLAPHPDVSTERKRPQQLTQTHSESEWAAVYPEIQRLYVRERRRLRDVMQCMERAHGFGATEQMYKKRFTKWKFQKNGKRSPGPVRGCKTQDPGVSVTSSQVRSRRELVSSIPAHPRLGHGDSMSLMFLTSVRTWSISFFESVQKGEFVPSLRSPRATAPQPQSSQTQEIDFVFKLVINLLDRGHGDMAGRMARKAFLLAEDLLALEGPALVWNLLQILHHIVTLRHMRLFGLLLTHLTALADGQMPQTHPLPAILRGLRSMVTSARASTLHASPPSSVASLPSSAAVSSNRSSNSSSKSSRSSSHSRGDAKIPPIDLSPLSDALPSLLERAWVLNAEIFFDHFDPRLFQLYFGVLWDSTSIETPAAIVNTATRWFAHTDAQQMLSPITVAASPEEPGMTNPIPVDNSSTIIQRFLTLRPDVSLPENYEMLHGDTIAALREREDFIVRKGPSFDGDASILLRILVCLTTTRTLEGLPAAPSNSADDVTMSVSRLQVANIACASRTLLDLDTKQHLHGQLGTPLDAVDRIGAIVALREYAHGETYPQVLWEMLLLQEALIASGKYVEAGEVERDVYLRMEKYMQDIPVDYV